MGLIPFIPTANMKFYKEFEESKLLASCYVDDIYCSWTTDINVLMKIAEKTRTMMIDMIPPQTLSYCGSPLYLNEA